MKSVSYAENMNTSSSLDDSIHSPANSTNINKSSNHASSSTPSPSKNQDRRVTSINADTAAQLSQAVKKVMNEVTLLKTQYQEMIDRYQYLDSCLSNIEAHNNITPLPFKKSAPLSAAAKSYQPAASKPSVAKDIEKVVGQQTAAINKQLYQQQQSTSSSNTSNTVSRQE